MLPPPSPVPQQLLQFLQLAPACQYTVWCHSTLWPRCMHRHRLLRPDTALLSGMTLFVHFKANPKLPSAEAALSCAAPESSPPYICRGVYTGEYDIVWGIPPPHIWCRPHAVRGRLRGPRRRPPCRPCATLSHTGVGRDPAPALQVTGLGRA